MKLKKVAIVLQNHMAVTETMKKYQEIYFF